MDTQTIISKINSFLHEASICIARWLNSILPRVTDEWWEDCVLQSLTYTQRDIAASKGFSRLSDFDLAALLRIADKSWYDMRTIAYLPNEDREVIRAMKNVRNNWAHCSAELPGKDTILNDLKTIYDFIGRFGGERAVCGQIYKFISDIEKPDSIPVLLYTDDQNKNSEIERLSDDDGKEIQVNNLVYLVGSPEVKGVVMSVKDIDSVKQYSVFVNGGLKQFFSGQIALVRETASYNWVNADAVRSYLTAYQINNPSSRNLYSLNSARIDFVPYQFRPALKMIHADEPRILIADSVGVGKTIEAGLIIKELEARFDLNKVAIICPKPLVAERKWELEMKRFDEDFIPIDGKTFQNILSDTDRDGEWPVRYNKVIIPYSIMNAKIYNGDEINKLAGLTELDPKPHFDLVIVDEAHNIRTGSMDKEKAFAYKCTKFFCDNADAVIMLTATPLQTDDKDLFTLLNILRPDVVIDHKTFDMMSRPNAYISQAVRAIRAAKDGWQHAAESALTDLQKTQWGDNVIAENPLYNDVLGRLENEKITREDRIKLISDIESLHSFASMINRTRRRDIQDFCIRRTYTISVEFTEYQRALHDELLAFERSTLSSLHNTRNVQFMMSTVKRQAASCIFGLSKSIRDIVERRMQQLNNDPEIENIVFDIEDESRNIIVSLAKSVLELADNLPEDDPKFDKTLDVIEKKQKMQNNKIMLFSTFLHTLAYLKRRLLALGYRVAQIDGSTKDEERYNLKGRFELPKEDPDALDILLFTEVASEGLDYQFCDTMINYDLPWNPMRIEQRIGRIDRRGQRSEAVNIYNIITEDTVDSEIYHRCLKRIGVFQSSIGDCDEILGKINDGIEKIVLNPSLSDDERKLKLEQIADNEVRKLQEMIHLEEEEKELFGFDLTEFTTTQEIRRAENPWLSQRCLQKFIENYIKEKVGDGNYIIGESGMKTLRLSFQARDKLRGDLEALPGGKNAMRRAWETYLKGRTPNHAITFDPEEAAKDRESFFITPMHPLAKQAAKHFENGNVSCIYLQHFTSDIAEGEYVFSVYAWKYAGSNLFTRLITISENEIISNELPYILEYADSTEGKKKGNYSWDALEDIHVKKWLKAKEDYKKDAQTNVAFKLESLSNNHRNRIRTLEQQLNDALDESIKRMRQSELESVIESYERKVSAIKEAAEHAEIYTTLLVKGVIVITKE